ncbi:septum formation protein Maf [Candidatus Bipolaricaulota bacterium]|nr:septum formation protein Maf [Candidatus Bipolaricaulota bacterium]
MSIILASKSPRRQTLLARITSDFVVIPSHAEESTTGTPREQVLASARAKAHAVGETHAGIILGADTVVVLGEHVLGKPRTREEAGAMLRSLSERTHVVLTGMHLWNTTQDIERELCVETDVRFRAISEQEIEWYLASGEYSDKAGAYGIQGRAAVFIEGIVGEYTNVMGLPLCELSRLLREVGMTL